MGGRSATHTMCTRLAGPTPPSDRETSPRKDTSPRPSDHHRASGAHRSLSDTCVSPLLILGTFSLEPAEEIIDVALGRTCLRHAVSCHAIGGAPESVMSPFRARQALEVELEVGLLETRRDGVGLLEGADHVGVGGVGCERHMGKDLTMRRAEERPRHNIRKSAEARRLQVSLCFGYLTPTSTPACHVDVFVLLTLGLGGDAPAEPI